MVRQPYRGWSTLVVVAERDRAIDATQALADSDRQAQFGRLAMAELQFTYALAARILGNRPEAEDAVHEAILKAWVSFDGLRDLDRFRPWFTRIVVNACRDRLRRRRIVQTEALGDRELEAGDPFEHGIDREAIRRALDTLSQEQRIAVVLHFWADLPVREIARICAGP
jgi:RNA polymerase sigma-70 factor (ECF subfamily)